MAAPQISCRAGWISGASLFSRILDKLQLHRFWEWISLALMKTPGRIWLIFVVCMIPFAYVGIAYHGYMSYGLLSELPRSKPSVIGAHSLEKHFPSGNTAPLTVLLENPNLDFSDPDVLDLLGTFARKIADKKQDLGISDIRSLSNPMGLDRKVTVTGRAAARLFYISREKEYDGHVTRLDLIFEKDPFSRDSIQQVVQVEKLIDDLLSPNNPDNQALPDNSATSGEEQASNSLLPLVGTKAHIRGDDHQYPRPQNRHRSRSVGD